MTTIGLITYHNSYNYGAVLQAYATVVLLQKHGFDVKVINYIPEFLQDYGTLKKTYIETSYRSTSILKRLFITAVRFPSYRRLRRVFNQFINDTLPLSIPCFSSEDVKRQVLGIHILCTGSDQVWNDYYTHYLDGAFFLDFASNEQKCFSLASSFGKEHFEEKEKAYIQSQLKKYEYLSVREHSGLKLLQELGYTNASIMLDPTLLIPQNVWESFADEMTIRSPYILVYQLHGDGKAYKKAIEFGKKKGLLVVRIDTFLHQFRLSGKHIIAPNPQEFVGLFKNADYVFTDSFHGTVFSLIFGRVVAIDLPHKFSDRILTLLSSVGATEFILQDINKWEAQIQKIDYVNIQRSLASVRERKIAELEDYLMSIKE